MPSKSLFPQSPLLHLATQLRAVDCFHTHFGGWCAFFFHIETNERTHNFEPQNVEENVLACHCYYNLYHNVETP